MQTEPRPLTYRNPSDLQSNNCPRCSAPQMRSPGEPCRRCGADSWDYGPVFYGYAVVDGKRQRIAPWVVTFA